MKVIVILLYGILMDGAHTSTSSDELFIGKEKHVPSDIGAKIRCYRGKDSNMKIENHVEFKDEQGYDY
jgi:hypothetical protein